MPATFQTLDAARILVDYAEADCDPATVKLLYGLLEGIAADLAQRADRSRNMALRLSSIAVVPVLKPQA